MAGRGRGKFLPTEQGNFRQAEPVDPLAVYIKMSENLPNTLEHDPLKKWMKDVFTEVIANYDKIIDIARYLDLFIHSNNAEKNRIIKKIFLQQLEASYHDFVKGEEEATKYRNFTYFFGASAYYMRRCLPISELINPLLILISRLNTIDNIQDIEVYSKGVYWLSKLIFGQPISKLQTSALQEAINKLREILMFGRGRGALPVACLEACLSDGVLNDSARDFYTKTLIKNDLIAFETTFTISIPEKDKNLYNLVAFDKVNYL